MKLSICCLLLVIVCVSDAKRGSFRYRGKSGGNVGSRGSCQRMPRPMSLDRFRSEVVNSRYTEILLGTNYDVDVEALVYHFAFVYNETPDADVFEEFVSGRLFGETGDGVCNSTSTRILTALHPQFAAFDRAGHSFDWYYFSSDPSNYVIEAGCEDLSGTLPGRQCCEGRWFFSVYSKNDPPHFLDWKGIERDLWRQMGLCLSNNRWFIYALNECPNAGP